MITYITTLDLAYCFMDRCLERLTSDALNMREELMKKEFDERLVLLLQLRMSYLADYSSTWREVMSQGVIPRNAPATIMRLRMLADEVCHLSMETDFNLASWGGRRFALISTYASAELFALTDTSHNLQETQDYIARKLPQILTIGRMSYGALAGFRSLLTVLPSVGVFGSLLQTPFPPDHCPEDLTPK